MRFVKYFFIVSISVIWSSPIFLLAQSTPAAPQYDLLAPIPLSGDINSQPNTSVDPSKFSETYLPGLVKLIIGLAGVLAVIMIIYGGLAYMMGEGGSSKSNAKNIIQNALSGFLLVITAWLILSTISPNLVKFNLKFEALQISGGNLSTDLSKENTNTYESVLPSKENIAKELENYGGCSDCIPIIRGDGALFPNKWPNGCQQGASICYINSSLAKKLESFSKSVADLKDPTKGISIKWQVTEMFPPTLNKDGVSVHDSPCHNGGPTAGTCVDAAIDRQQHYDNIYINCISPSVIDRFLSSLENTGLTNYQYEVPSSKDNVQYECYDRYQNSKELNSKFKSKIRRNNVSKQHIHINL